MRPEIRTPRRRGALRPRPGPSRRPGPTPRASAGSRLGPPSPAPILPCPCSLLRLCCRPRAPGPLAPQASPLPAPLPAARPGPGSEKGPRHPHCVDRATPCCWSRPELPPSGTPRSPPGPQVQGDLTVCKGVQLFADWVTLLFFFNYYFLFFAFFSSGSWRAEGEGWKLGSGGFSRQHLLSVSPCLVKPTRGLGCPSRPSGQRGGWLSFKPSQ